MPDSATSPSLRELSEAATQGTWIPERMKGISFAGVYSDDATGSILAKFGGFEFAPRSDDETDANAKLSAALVNAYRAGLLLDAPTVAEREARARAEGRAEGLVWQSMETHKGDRIPVLLTVPPFDPADPPIVGEAYFDPEAEGGSWWWAGTSVGDYNATSLNAFGKTPFAWMPLPAPPALIPEARHEV